MTVGRYLAGVALLGLIIGPVAFAAVALRRRFLPELRGAVARLAEIIVALSMLIAIAEILGTVGAFRVATMVVGCAVIGPVVGMWALRGVKVREPLPDSAGDARADDRDRSTDRIAAVVAVLMVAVLLAQWTPATITALKHGMGEPDTLAQHMPFAARFVQQGSTTELPFLGPDFLNTFHPANSELLHAVGILPFGRDILSPLFNMGWMLLTLLAAWCVGRRFGVGTLGLIAIAVTLTAPVIAFTQPGAAKNDITSVFFIVAAIALAVHARWERPGLVVAGLAAGLAAGSRLTSLAAVAGLTVGMVIAAPRGERRAVALSLLVPVVVTGAYWYGRNFVRTGNPIPQAHLGFLPSPRIADIDRYGFSVAHYLTDARIWRVYYLPGLRQALGPAWSALLALAGIGAVASVARGRDPVIRVAGAAALVAAAAYVLMPSSAIGVEGEPTLFFLALRYAMPAIGPGLVLLPLLPWFRSRRAQVVLLALLATLFVSMQTVAGIMPAWLGTYRRTAAVVAVCVVLAAVALFLYQRRRPAARVATAAALLVVLVAIAGGWKIQDVYLRGRYATARNPLEATYAWARGVHDADIAFAGFFQHYPLYGLDLSNRAQYIGRHTPHGGFTTTRSCAEFRRGLRAGRFDFLVVAPSFGGSVEPREAAWARGDPAATEILHDGPVSIFRYTGPADPAGCL